MASELELKENVTRTIIARRMNVSKVTVGRWVKHPDFPKPEASVYGVKVYDWEAVVAWRVKRKRRWIPK